LTAIDKSQNNGYHYIDVEISITLECFASYNITWGYPRNYEPLITYEFSNTTLEFRSTLTIDKTNSSHTGSYFCQYLKTETLDADIIRVWFNLFVNGEKMFTFNKSYLK
jgi:hypothetical protein